MVSPACLRRATQKVTSKSTIPGVHVGGPHVLWKRIENSFLIGVPLIGSGFAVHHAFAYGVTAIDVTSFLLFFFLVGLGVSLGLHRLFSHSSFEPRAPIAYFLGAMGTMAFQGSIRRWVADHRRHHAHADQEGDVHSPRADPWGQDIAGWRGFVHAHIGWMFDNTATDMSVYGKGLMEDPVISFFTRTHALWLAASLALPYGFGYLLGGPETAYSSLLFGGFLRTTVLHNVVWSVASFGHSVGDRNFEQDNSSTNIYILALLTLGDGWHNNHHRFPRSYRHGLYAGEIDFNARFVEFLHRRGWAQNLIDSSEIERTQIRTSEQIAR